MLKGIVPELILNNRRERTKGRRYHIVALPDYVVTTFKSLGVSLSDLDDMLRLYYEHDVEDNNGSKMRWILESKLLDWFEEKLSKNDVSDIMTANEMVSELLSVSNIRSDTMSQFMQDSLWSLKKRGYDYESTRRDFISFYADHSINTDNYVLDDDNNVKIVDTVITETTVFVILHRGFTNFKVYNDLSFKKKFSSFMLNLVFKAYGEEAVVYSDFFSDYVMFILINTKNPL